MGEGAESFDAAFNNTERAYKNMKNNVDNLRVVLENHQSLQPPGDRRGTITLIFTHKHACTL